MPGSSSLLIASAVDAITESLSLTYCGDVGLRSRCTMVGWLMCSRPASLAATALKVVDCLISGGSA